MKFSGLIHYFRVSTKDSLNIAEQRLLIKMFHQFPNFLQRLEAITDSNQQRMQRAFTAPFHKDFFFEKKKRKEKKNQNLEPVRLNIKHDPDLFESPSLLHFNKNMTVIIYVSAFSLSVFL